MFCTECGQQMADEAKFCAYCGTRRALPAFANDAQSVVPPKPEAPGLNPTPVRTIRSTAEIMPMRVRPAAPKPPFDEPVASEPAAEWPEEESAAPPMYVPDPPVAHRERASVPAPPNPPVTQPYNSVPPVEAPSPDVARRHQF